MPYAYRDYEIVGRGRDSNRQRNRIYSAKCEADAVLAAQADGTIVEKVSLIALAPATDAQRDYARKLNISFPQDIDIQAMSILISRALGDFHLVPATDEQRFRAWRQGIEHEEDISEAELSDLLASHELALKMKMQVPPAIKQAFLEEVPAVCLAMRWVYSVCRHIAKANWLVFGDSELNPHEVEQISRRIVATAGLIAQIEEKDEGFSDEFDELASAANHDTNGFDSRWFFFGEFGASTRTKVYRFVAELVSR